MGAASLGAASPGAAPSDVVDLDPVFVGRQESLHGLEAAFASGLRLVTLLGAPGLGKSRLARRFAAGQVAQGLSTFWIEVEARLESDELLARMATAVGAQPAERGAAGLEVVIESLRVQGSLLLVLDGLEASLGPARALLEGLLSRCPELRILSTSQAPLGLLGEQRFELSPLDRAEADALFRARARQAMHTFEVLERDERVLESLLDQLERVPLAIELAAGHVGTLSLVELERRLAPDATPLPSPRRDGPPRHRTMGEAVAWAWSLLDPSLQRALADLSVFRGPFTVEGAEAVLSPGRNPGPLEAVERLRERSLLRRVGGRGRLQILGEVRRFAEQRRGVEDVPLRARHARWFAGRLDRTIDVMYGMPSSVDLEDLELEQDDLRAALAFGEEHDPEAAVRCALVLARYHSVRGPGWSALDAIDRGLDVVGRLLNAGELRARLEMAHGIIARAWFGRLEPERLADAIVRLNGSHPALEAEARAHRAYILIEGQRWEEAQRETAAAVSLAEADGHPVSVTLCRGLVGLSRFAEGDVDGACREFERALASGGASASARMRARYLACRGQARIEQGELALAHQDLEEALRLQDEECRDRLYAPVTVIHLANWALAMGRHEEAESYAHEAARRIQGVGFARVAADPNHVLGWVFLERGEVDAARLTFGRGADSPRPAARRASALGLTAAALWEGQPQRALDESEAHVASVGEEGGGHLPILLALRAEALRQLGRPGVEAAGRAAREALVDGGSRRARAFVDCVVDGVSVAVSPAWPELRGLRRTVSSSTPSWQYDLRRDVLVGPDGRQLEARSRAKLARLLRVLARARVHRPGEFVNKDAIIEAVWPGDRASSGALENRLWVALSSFRKLGFGDLVERVESGYRFRVDQPFEVLGEDDETSEL